MSEKVRCEGYRRYGGAFSLGPPVWRQCENDATVILKIEQDGNVGDLPGCHECWKEAQEKRLRILEVKPL